VSAEQPVHPLKEKADIVAIRARIQRFADEAHAKHVIVLDTSGHVLSAEGMYAAEHDVALGALLAGVFGSAREMATMLGEPDFRALFQQGANASIYTLLIPDQWLLVTVFDRQSQVGLVRMLAAQVADDLAGALGGMGGDVAAVRELVHSTPFQRSFDATIDQLFHDDPLQQGDS
jgi:predicted regulator of Ras-like GTPase activity (Roadblock/LC7/MglB family)